MTEQKPRTLHAKIGLAEVKAIEPGQTVWDSGKGAVAGFGIRRQKGPTVTFVLTYRSGGRSRWHTIGTAAKGWTPDKARAEAKALVGAVEKGADPAAEKQAKRKAETVAELCQMYFNDAKEGRVLVRGGKPKKLSTLENDRARIDRHIIPLLGVKHVADVSKKDIEKFMHDVGAGKTKRAPQKTKPRGISRVRGGRGVATRTIGLLGAIFSYAVDHGMRLDNPAHRIRKYAEGKRERRLSDDEYANFGKGLRAAVLPHLPPGAKINVKPSPMWPPAVACAQFLALTGWRMSEALDLRWKEVDTARRTAVLEDTKTGKSMRPLSHAACDVLRGLGRGADEVRVFPATRGDGPMRGFKKFLRRIVALGGLPWDITAHVLRHSFASVAADLEYSEATIAALIGHKKRGVTQRYVHAADAVLLAAADAVAIETLKRMGEMKSAATVHQLRP